jgi:hypothetical protein
MDEAGSNPRPRKPFFMIAAWFSLVVPLLAAGWAYYMGSAPHGPDRPNPHLSKADSVGLALVFGISFVAGCMSLWGVKTNGAWRIVPPAVLGILVSVVFEVIALIFVVLSGLPGP